MAEPGNPREVRGAEVRCTGTKEAPHPPERLAVPAEGVATCPVCGAAYRRARGWRHLSGACWPKPE